MTLPILYSLRNCPFAMRARIAIFKSTLSVELRDVNLKNKPNEMIQASAKATVPIIVLPNSQVIDESLDVMRWALSECDPENLLHVTVDNEKGEQFNDALNLAQLFDQEFKSRLEAYKCAKRYHETNLLECREACEIYVQQLEQRLALHSYLVSHNESLADIAILPFIRQFARVERQWYLQSHYPNVKRWLNTYLQSAMFTRVMAKYPLWSTDNEASIFSAKK